MKKKLRTLLFVLVLLVTSPFLFRYVSMKQREHHIFCELLIPGMNTGEVVNTLKEFGDYNYRLSTSGKEYIELYGGFRDPQVVGENHYYLKFKDGGFIDVSKITGFERVDWVCPP